MNKQRQIHFALLLSRQNNGHVRIQERVAETVAANKSHISEARSKLIIADVISVWMRTPT